jgi:hypothetical protein
VAPYRSPHKIAQIQTSRHATGTIFGSKPSAIGPFLEKRKRCAGFTALGLLDIAAERKDISASGDILALVERLTQSYA